MVYFLAFLVVFTIPVLTIIFKDKIQRHNDEVIRHYGRVFRGEE